MRLATHTAAAALILAAGFALPAVAAPDQLRPVGSVTFDPEPSQPEVDVINIRSQDRRISAMRILAEDGSADVRSLKVTYTDGSVETVRVRQTLQEGQRSAVFELEEVRPIRSVEITYIPKGAVTLTLLADSGRAAPPPPPPPPRAASWVEIDCSKVSLLNDREKFSFSTTEPMRALRLRSANYDIEVGEMLISYDNGARDSYPIRSLIRAGSTTAAIPLRGDARRINGIDFIYRARTIGPVKTKLCVDGLREDPEE